MARNDKFRESISGGFRTSRPREHQIRTQLHQQREQVRLSGSRAGVPSAVIEEALQLFDSTSSVASALAVIERAARSPELRINSVPELGKDNGI